MSVNEWFQNVSFACVASFFQNLDSADAQQRVEMTAFCCQSACMATLTIRGFPDDLHAALKERARKNRRSLNQEVIVELSEAAGASDEARRDAARKRMQRTMAAIEEIRAGMTTFMSAEEIDAAIEEGRA